MCASKLWTKLLSFAPSERSRYVILFALLPSIHLYGGELQHFLCVTVEQYQMTKARWWISKEYQSERTRDFDWDFSFSLTSARLCVSILAACCFERRRKAFSSKQSYTKWRRAQLLNTMENSHPLNPAKFYSVGIGRGKKSFIVFALHNERNKWIISR